jgi:beta-lactam-binding protein with PASTA domain
MISKTITMPDLVGLSMRQAKAEVLSRGLVLGKLIYESDLATNNVLRQLVKGVEVEPGTELPAESVVDVVVGLNSRDCSTYVPDVVGLKQISAVDAVHDNSLNIKTLQFDRSVKDYDDSLNAMVWRQVPEPSDSVHVKMGSDVTLYLTLDTNKIPVREIRNDGGK